MSEETVLVGNIHLGTVKIVGSLLEVTLEFLNLSKHALLGALVVSQHLPEIVLKLLKTLFPGASLYLLRRKRTSKPSDFIFSLPTLDVQAVKNLLHLLLGLVLQDITLLALMEDIFFHLAELLLLVLDVLVSSIESVFQLANLDLVTLLLLT